MQKARRQPLPRGAIGLRQLVSVWFQVHYPPLVGILPIVRSRYYSLSVAREYLALRDGPRSFRPRFTCTVLLRNRTHRCPLPRTGLSPAMAALSRAFR
jgi:hypothetical protein